MSSTGTTAQQPQVQEDRQFAQPIRKPAHVRLREQRRGAAADIDPFQIRFINSDVLHRVSWYCGWRVKLASTRAVMKA